MAARNYVQYAYGFKGGLTAQSRQYNQERVAFIRTARTFAYEVR